MTTQAEIQAIREREMVRNYYGTYNNDIKTLLSHIDAQAAEIERLRGLLNISSEVYCDVMCPSVLKTAEGPSHIELCIEMQEALADKKEGV